MKSIWSFGPRAVLITALAVLASGCASDRKTGTEGSETNEASPLEALTLTDWQLVEFQSMSDEIGTVRPEDPSLYTLSFASDGKVSMRLNCNRGSGSWSATPTSSSGGSIEFGPIAATRAFCPPPSLDEQIARDFEYVRSYIIEENRLYLSLMADGGIYVWERLAESE